MLSQDIASIFGYIVLSGGIGHSLSEPLTIVSEFLIKTGQTDFAELCPFRNQWEIQ